MGLVIAVVTVPGARFLPLAWIGFVGALSVERARSVLPLALCMRAWTLLDELLLALLYR